MSTPIQSLIAAIEGAYEGMSHSDLVLTCRMLANGRSAWQRECEAEKLVSKELWDILVMLNRGFDSHETKPDKIEITRDEWRTAVNRAEAVNPNHQRFKI